MSKVKCDICSKEFELSESIIKTRVVRDDIKEEYFNCPDCGHKYRIMLTDKNMRGLIKLKDKKFEKLLRKMEHELEIQVDAEERLS